MRSVDKCFNLTANYPKGDGDSFRGHMEEYHPTALLFHAKNTKGNRQDIITESAGPIYMNRMHYVECLDRQLRSLRKSNILEENVSVFLSSIHVVVLLRSHSTFFLLVVLPMRWLCMKTHELANYDWSVRSMGRVVDTLETKMVEFQQEPSNFINDSFMMHVFDEFVEELPPLKEHIEHMFEQKQQHKLLRESSKDLPCNLLRNELFTPDDPSNVDAYYLMNEMGVIFSKTILKELRNKNKATHDNLSSLDGMCSWKMATELEKKAVLGITATNHVAESSFGGRTQVLTNHRTVGLTSAGAIAMTRQNGDFATKPMFASNKGNFVFIACILCVYFLTNFCKETENTSQEIGITHQLSNEMHTSLLTMARRLRPMKAKSDCAKLKEQLEEKRKK